MKGFYGLLTIFLFYLLVGLITKAAIVPDTVIIYIYLILVVLCLITMFLLNKVYSKKLLFRWGQISSFPALLFSFLFCFDDKDTSTMLPASFVYGIVWYWFVLPLLGIIQIFFILYLIDLKYEKNLLESTSKNNQQNKNE